MPMQGSLSIERMCLLARVSRAGFYRFLKEHVPSEEDTEVRSAIQQVALEHCRRYGYRRVTAELKRRGMQVNTIPPLVTKRQRNSKLKRAAKPKQNYILLHCGFSQQIRRRLQRRWKGKGLRRRPFPKPLPGLENQRDDFH